MHIKNRYHAHPFALFIGKSLNEAKQMISKVHKFREVKIDGKPQSFEYGDINPRRINVVTEHGLITEVIC